MPSPSWRSAAWPTTRTKFAPWSTSTVSCKMAASLLHAPPPSPPPDRVFSTDAMFASGSHAGELIVWDALDYNVLAYQHILWEEPQTHAAQSNIQTGGPKTSEMSIQHLASNGNVSHKTIRELFSTCRNFFFCWICFLRWLFSAGGGGGRQRRVRVQRGDQGGGGVQEVRPRLGRAARRVAFRQVGLALKSLTQNLLCFFCCFCFVTLVSILISAS